jgi:MFS family permease
MLIFAIFDVVPLWCIASLTAGGLAFSEEEVGTLLALSAAGQLIYTSLCMGKVVNLLGRRLALIGGCGVAGLAIGALPFVGSLDAKLHQTLLAALIYAVFTSAMLTAGTGEAANRRSTARPVHLAMGLRQLTCHPLAGHLVQVWLG